MNVVVVVAVLVIVVVGVMAVVAFVFGLSGVVFVVGFEFEPVYGLIGNLTLKYYPFNVFLFIG